ncbi:hypothetical protein LCGC14_2269350 [marine sediment metagenome]|uniref:Peptidase S10 serine carboxypeptidase n=1 Tax=marine sediment metagenome TaxID=412755 RepID=A0A0F9FSG1_9ZZZZ
MKLSRIISLPITVIALIISTSTLADNQRRIDVDSKVVTQHKAKINGQRFSYTVATGTQPVWDDKGDAVATLQYTYYTRDKVDDRTARPLLISFNGGPGSASVWMHLAYTGPRVLKIDDEGYPIQPYGVKDNPYSVLDIADIVYVNPVNTGYSRVLENEKGELPSKAKQKELAKLKEADADEEKAEPEKPEKEEKEEEARC